MPVSIQVTIGASRTQFSKSGHGFKQMLVQNNSADSTVRIGDSTVVAGAYGVGLGLLLVGSASANLGAVPIQGGVLSNWYAAGVMGTVLDVTYEPA